MVKGTKDGHPAKASNADESIETMYLKLKNRDLAKRLAETQKNIVDLQRERDQMQQNWFNERLRANKNANRLQKCTSACQTVIKHMCAMSEAVHTLMEELVAINEEDDKVAATTTAAAAQTTPKQKTKAVQPMVSGCTISKPTIKIKRISEEQLLQATMNGENEPREGVDMLQPIVHIRRLPECSNIAAEPSVAEVTENALLSTIMEQTECSTSRTQQTIDADSSARLTPRFTSTPLHESASASTMDDAAAPSSRRSLFVTKRSTKRSRAAAATEATASVTTRKFSPGSPRVVLRRLSRHDDNENNVAVKQEPGSRKSRRNAAKKVVSYKEPPLMKKLRRDF